MNSRKFFAWCREAARDIEYRPDRDAVHQELYEHLEDRYEACIARGMRHEDAEATALQAMGDAAEIAPQLAAIHRPFWAYCMVVTRCILIAVLTILVLPMWRYLDTLSINAPTYTDYHPYEDAENGSIFYAEPNLSDSSDGYTFTLTQAALWPEDRFYFQIEITNPRPWADQPNVVQWFWAEDSLGNYYHCMNNANVSADSFVYGSMDRTGWLTYTLSMKLQNYVSQDASWIDIHYDRAGRDLIFRIDLTGGDLS